MGLNYLNFPFTFILSIKSDGYCPLSVLCLTDPEDEVVLNGVLLPPPDAVHTGWPLDGLLFDVGTARRLQPLLHAVRGGRHVYGLGGLDLKGAPFDVLVVQTQRQIESPLFGSCEEVLVSSILIVQNLPLPFAAVEWGDLGGDDRVAHLAQLPVFVLGGDGDGCGHAHHAVPQPLAGGHRLRGHGVGGQDGPQVVDRLLQAVRLHQEVQLVVLAGLQGQILAGELHQPLAHLLLHQQHLGLRAVAQRLLREVAGAVDALLALQQGVQLGLEHLHMDTREQQRLLCGFIDYSTKERLWTPQTTDLRINYFILFPNF